MHTVTAATQAVPLTTLGGLVTLASPDSLPEGASPRNYDVDFGVGGFQTRSGLTNVYAYTNSASTVNPGTSAQNIAITGNAWSSPGNILGNDGTFATCVPGSGSDALAVTQFAFNLNATSVTGVQVVLTGFANSNVQVQAQLVANGALIGTPKAVTLPAANGAVTLGSLSDAWGASLSQAIVNETTFGIQITASSAFPAGNAYLDYVTVQVGHTAANANFNFLTTFTAQNGTVKNIALDNAGSLWVEDVTNHPGALTLALEGLEEGLFARAVNGPDVEYLTFNDLNAGADIPRQYTPNWVDRISQVGPGASPQFASSANAAGAAAAITAYSVTSNTVMLTAANSFSAGQLVLFSGLTSASFLNGQYLLVSSAGLNSTQFQVSFTHANVSTTADSGTATPQTNYPIATISQPAQVTYGGGAYLLQSSGPGSTSPGNVYTVYYSDSTLSSADADLVAAFNAGNPVYLWWQFNNPYNPPGAGPLVVQVTSVGLGSPPGQPRQFYYFTFNVTNVAYGYAPGSGHPGNTTVWQRTAATVTLANPVPALAVGSSATIAGASVTAYDSTWTITQALNSGAMQILQTSLTAGVATYSYVVTSGANPTAGQLVTITGALNGNGLLNGVDLQIATVSGTTAGTFTVNNFSAVTDYAPQAEQGQATTAGTQFVFDPGAAQVTTANDPIFGASAGGYLIFAGNGQYVGAGTRQGVVGFITRNGFWTPPCAPVTFDVTQNATAILSSAVPLGPPNVIGRWFAFTEPGSNGVPGANFFTIPTPVQYVANGTTYTADALVLNDNTSTTATFFFTDAVLLNAQAVDVQGNNLFNLIELENPGWVKNYDSRNFYGMCLNKIQNFTNLPFDGGYLPGARLVPLGWTQPDAYGSLLVSPVFGNSYYIRNTTTSTLATAGLIQQTAYQDAYNQPILQPNTAYSVRVSARIPAGLTTGALVLALVANGVTYGKWTLPFASMAAVMQTFTGTLLTSKMATVPEALMLQVYASGIGAGADVEIDRIAVFDTAIPVLQNQVFVSYANNLEAVDGITGVQGVGTENQQPCYGAEVLYDTLYLLKQGSFYSTQASANLEPSYWQVNEVSQKVGLSGMNGSDTGEQWLMVACRNGLYLFDGGQPGKIMEEIVQIWNALNWAAGNSIWVRNDVANRRVLIGVPMPTPNFWLPNAPLNVNPTTPNVMLMMNYQGCDSGDAIKTEAQMHTTMFGTLNAIDMRRKWSIWQIASPFAEMVTAETGTELYIGNGAANSKIYKLDASATTDDGAPINALYTTFGFVDAQKSQQMPALGMFRKRVRYGTITGAGSGVMNVRLLPNVLLGPADNATGYNPWTVPGGFPLTPTALQDREFSANFVAQRTFVEFSCSGFMGVSRLVLMMAKDAWNQLTGQR